MTLMLFSQYLKTHITTRLLIFILPLSFLLFSCDNEDDINQLFVGKTWYVTGCTCNGVRVGGDELKSLYSIPETYMLQFTTGNSFTLTLEKGHVYAGQWHADGSNQRISFNMSNSEDESENPLSSKVYHIIEQSRYYSGDEHNMTIKQDKHNYVIFSSVRDI